MPDTTKELPESIEVIESEIEQTREGLADKLEALTQQLTGTVEGVGETVENVVETTKETIETVVETTKETISNIKETFNIPKQVEQHPWLAMGASVLVGFVGGKILASLTSGTNGNTGYATNGWAEPVPQRMASASAYPTETQRHDHGAPREDTHNPSRGWFAELGEQFSSELNKAKGLAVGTLLGVVRDMVGQTLPETVKSQVAGLFDSVTEKLGGEPIAQGSLATDSGNQSR
jgi:predicted RNase H-like HicB family nuclease